jgi:adenylate cyclase, class 2
MAKEVEIKLRIEDLRALRRRLSEIGARVTVQRTFERNLLFDTPEAELKKRERVVRIRKEMPARGRTRQPTGVLLTFKGPLPRPGKSKGPEVHKTREEIELEASDGGALTKILQRLGLQEWFRYEKFRTTFALAGSARWAKGLEIVIDETPMGVFAELEGPVRAIDRAAREMGFAKHDYVTANYIELYQEYRKRRRNAPRNMVFGGRSGLGGKKLQEN